MAKLTPRDTGKGLAETFTGDVYVDNIVAPQPPSRMFVAAVGFTPGARTHRHSHALGQVLHCTDGLGFAATRDGIVIVLRPGETGWTPPGEASAVPHAAHAPSVCGARTTRTKVVVVGSRCPRSGAWGTVRTAGAAGCPRRTRAALLDPPR